MKYYKVVRKRRNFVAGNVYEYISAIIDQVNFQMEYKVGEWTKKIDGTGGIFIFGDLESARTFVKDNQLQGCSSIFECQVRNPRKLKYRYATSYNLLDFWNKFFKLRQKHKNTDGVYSLGDVYICPENTYIANEVKLVKEI